MHKTSVYRGVSRSRRLSTSEAAKYRKARDRLKREIPPAPPTPMRVAVAKLRAMRQARGVSLAELAVRTGITRGNLARLESQKNATLKTLQRYAEGIGCRLEIQVLAEPT